MTGLPASTREVSRPTRDSAREAPMLAALRRYLQPGATPGRCLLRAEGLGPAPQRRLARLLFDDAAAGGGGEPLETTAGELVLLAGTAAATSRLAARLTHLAPAVAVATWALPGDAAPALAWAARTAIAMPAPPAEPIDPTGFDAVVAGLPLAAIARRDPIVALAPRAPPMAIAWWERICGATLAARLGPLAEDPDLRAEAAARAAALLLPRPAMPGPPPWRAWPNALAPHAAPAPGAAPGAVAILPLGSAADPDAFATLAEALAAGGWGIALGGLGAATLAPVALAALPAARLLLRWSPELASPAAAAALRAIDPAALVLTGCVRVDAIGWGLRAGIRHFAGAAAAAALGLRPAPRPPAP